MTDLSRSIDPEFLFAQADWLRALARSIVRDADAAEDVVQDTLVAALEHDGLSGSPGPRPAGRVRAWLATIAANFARRRRRANDVRRFHERSVASGRPEGVASEDELELVRLQQLLSERVLRLREPYRTAVVLRFQQGLSYSAIARRLGVTPAAARKRVSRGLTLLREDMQSHERMSGLALVWLLGNGRQGPWASALTLGGLTMSAKSVWIGVAATAVALFGWTALRGGPAGPTPESELVDVSPKVALASPEETSKDGSQISKNDDVRAAVPVEAVEEVEEAILPAELLIRGRVVDGEGSPVSGAAVVLQRDPLRVFSLLDLETTREAQPVSDLETAGDGSFQFQVARGTPYDLVASLSGLGKSLVQTAYAGEEVELVLIAPARFLGRVIRQDRTAVADALVEAVWLPSRQPAFSGRTDADGGFLFEDLVDGKVQVKVVPHGESMLWGQQLTLEAGQTREHEFIVEPGPTIVGRITDATTGQPIEGATVGQGYTYEKVVTSDAEGRYELVGFANIGVYSVYAKAPGYGQGYASLPRTFTDRMTGDIVLRPAVRASGRVVDSGGAPISGAYVAAAFEGSGWRSAHTDAAGEFRLDGLEPDRPHSLFVVAKGFGTSAFEFPRPLRAQGEYVLGDVQLPRGSLVSGRIVEPSGRPLAGVDIHLTGRYEERFALSGALDETVADSYLTEREGRTDAEGRFAFGDLAPGIYTVGAGPSGQTFLRSEEILVPTSSEIEGLEIVLDAGWDIEGQVVDENGEPVAGIVITLFPELPTQGRMAQLFTGEDGRFNESGFALGTYRVDVASTELRPDHYTRPLAPQLLKGVDPFEAPLRVVLLAE